LDAGDAIALITDGFNNDGAVVAFFDGGLAARNCLVRALASARMCSGNSLTVMAG